MPTFIVQDHYRCDMEQFTIWLDFDVKEGATAYADLDICDLTQ